VAGGGLVQILRSIYNHTSPQFQQQFPAVVAKPSGRAKLLHKVNKRRRDLLKGKMKNKRMSKGWGRKKHVSAMVMQMIKLGWRLK
jgi:hypothetical protein